MVSSSEEVMLARLWDSTERQTLKSEKEDMEAGKLIDVPLLNPEQRQQYSSFKMINSQNERKRKRSGTPADENARAKVARVR